MTAPYYVYDLLDDAQDGRWNATAPLGTPVTLTYAFATTLPSEASGYSNFTPFSTAEQAAVKQAFAYISSFTGLTFTLAASGSADINFGNVDGGTNSDPNGFAGITDYDYNDKGFEYADVFLSNNSQDNIAAGPFTPGEISSDGNGGYSWLTLIHEIGHSLGLKHPFEENDAGDPNSVLPTAQDNRLNSVMSYTDFEPDTVSFVSGKSYESFDLEPSTYGAFDIAALQYLYGANASNSAGGKTYVFSPNTPIFETISGQGDTIDCSELTGACSINLNPGASSTLAISQQLPAFAVPQQAYNGTDALTLAYDCTIAACLCGSGNDTVTDGPGSHTIDGGGGTNTLIENDTSADVAASIDSSGNCDLVTSTGTDTLERFSVIDLMDATISIGTNLLTQQDTNGSAVVSAFNIAGEPYTRTVYSYSSAGQLVSSLFGGVSGQPYSAYEYDYSAGDILTGSKFFYTLVTGKPYSGQEYDYDGGGNVTRVDFSGVSGTAYSSYEYDYTGGVFAGSKFEFTTVPNGASYSSYETDYNASSQFTGDKFFFSNVSGQSYTAEEEDFDGASHLTRVLLTGVSGQSYTSLEEDYLAGAYEGYKAFYTAISNQSYTGEEVDVSAANVITGATYTGLSSTPYSSVSETFANGALTGSDYSFTGQSGGNFYAYQVIDDASGHALQEIVDNDDGSHTIAGYQANQTFTSIGDDTFTGGGANETFVFNPIYGHDTVTDFASHYTGTGHDTLSFSTSEFANFAAVFANASDVSGSTVITAPSTGDSLTLTGVTKAMLSANSADVTFHA